MANEKIYTSLEDVKVQYEIIKTLKENNPSLVSQIAPLEDKLYNSLLSNLDLLQKDHKSNVVDTPDQTKVYDEIINTYKRSAKGARRFGWANLIVIVAIMAALTIVVVTSFRAIDNLIDPYIGAENRKNRQIDSLNAQAINISASIIKNLDQPYKGNTKQRASIDSLITRKDALLAKSLAANELAIKIVDERKSDFSRVENAMLYYLILSILALVTVMAISFYIVKVFVNIHRYNNILADHYEALSGTFKLMKNKKSFSSDLTLDSAYQLIHPQMQDYLEVSEKVGQNPDDIFANIKGFTDQVLFSKTKNEK